MGRKNYGKKEYTNYNKPMTNELITGELDIIETTDDDLYTSSAEPELSDFGTGKVFNCEKVYIREDISQDSPHLGILDAGDEVIIKEQYENWYGVETKDGLNGFVMKKFISVNQ